ncbi:MAG TPA: hypothetical protein DCS91_03895 [Microcoleaceae bacterium UBA11344]|nr:hypothetical protein [Microcoleaceae cyanobacterium UBA11344]
MRVGITLKIARIGDDRHKLPDTSYDAVGKLRADRTGRSAFGRVFLQPVVYFNTSNIRVAASYQKHIS